MAECPTFIPNSTCRGRYMKSWAKGLLDAERIKITLIIEI
jgi:hypothetical protein